MENVNGHAYLKDEERRFTDKDLQSVRETLRLAKWTRSG